MLKGNDVKKLIIKELPQLKANDISVRVRNYTSYNIALKKIVPLSKVKKAVEHLESIHKCEATGEILGGGNIYVFIEFMNWDYSKDKPYKFEVSENIQTAIKNVINYITIDESMTICQKISFIAMMILDSEVFTKDYTKSDIIDVVRVAYEADEELKKMIGT